ncbi:MAG: GWxTD domain-containing protein, partial [Bacteroidales bacterium]|nr:GWxTD domain-containing protein [Bacteroidales bacterium]
MSGLLVLIFFGFSCKVQQNTVQQRERNLADIYNPSRSSLHPDFTVHHVNDSNTVIYMRIITDELLFNQANQEGDFLAYIRVRYFLFEEDEYDRLSEISDSSTIYKTLNKSELRNVYFSAFPVKASVGKKYVVRIDVEDRIRNSISRNFMVIDKRSPYSAQNFRVLSYKSGYPAFTMNFSRGEAFRLIFNQMGFDSVYVDYYNMERTLPRPVFSSVPEIPMQTWPDSAWALPYNDSTSYTLGLPGIFMFKMNKDSREGVSLFNFGSSFPAAKTPDDLLGPLVYLTSSAEFRDLRMEPNRKLAVDNFWLGATGEMDDARELIRVFYNRVLFANLYFSAFKEGWKTDRGMIYIV